jgi:hypothetical protein
VFSEGFKQIKKSVLEVSLLSKIFGLSYGNCWYFKFLFVGEGFGE